MKRLGFRTRLFLVLSLFALVPAGVLTLAWGGAASAMLPFVGTTAAWDSVAESGRRAIELARRAPLSAEQRAALDRHEQELSTSLTYAHRVQFVVRSLSTRIIVAFVVGLLVLTLISSRVAGHLSRQLSRPLHELVGWTELIARGLALPEGTGRRGAPEFDVLRRRMRKLARELALGRERALEAERLRAFRETARRVAHELKNPLTPIRFAVRRLAAEAERSPHLADAVEVLEVESRRLEEMARSFSHFGRLPEGPAADVDLGEMARYVSRAAVPPGAEVTVEVDEAVPMVRGHHDALSRALANVLLNAVEASRGGECGVARRDEIAVRVARAELLGRPAVEVSVRDRGCGIPAERLAHIWEPYVTHKAGGTGLGLAIVRQTVLAHGGIVDAASRVGEGTEIRLVLPEDGGAGAPQEPEPHADVVGTGAQAGQLATRSPWRDTSS